MTHTELETAYIALCKTVERDAKRIVGMCGNGRTEAAGEAAVNLSQLGLTARLQYQMQQERAGGNYDLTALQVDATSASNSETGWERED